MSCNPTPDANPATPQEGKFHADMVAEMLSPAPVQAQPIGDFRLAQWDEFSTNIQQVGRNPKEWSLPIKFNEQRNDFRYALHPGEDKYTSPFYTMAILANLWESLLPDEQGLRYLHNFLAAVRTHIETYTIPRYATGCQYTDPLCKFTLADIDTQLTKYVTRYGSMERGDERILDIMKMAHYYQVGWSLWSLWSAKPADEPEPQAEPQPEPKPVWERDSDKSLNLLWTRVRSLEDRVNHREMSMSEQTFALLDTSTKEIHAIKILQGKVSALEERVHLTGQLLPSLAELQKETAGQLANMSDNLARLSGRIRVVEAHKSTIPDLQNQYQTIAQHEIKIQEQIQQSTELRQYLAARLTTLEQEVENNLSIQEKTTKILSEMPANLEILSERVRILESRPIITEAQKQVIDFHTPISF